MPERYLAGLASAKEARPVPLMSNTPLSSSRLDLLSLRLLLVAVEEGNLARAAERENIALSGVSRRISDLEQRLGLKLLYRHDRGVRPTPAAESILADLAQVFGLLDGIMHRVADIGAGTGGLVRIHANMTAIAGDLASHIGQLAVAHPHITVEIEEATTLDTIQSVRLGRCDIGIISGTVDADGLHLIPWIADILMGVVPASHALAARASLRFEEFLEYPFVCMQHESALQMLFRQKAAECGRELNECAHVSSFSAAGKLVAAGCGLSILPKVALPQTDHGPLAIRPLDESWARREVVLCLRSASMTPLLRTCVDFLCGRALIADGETAASS